MEENFSSLIQVQYTNLVNQDFLYITYYECVMKTILIEAVPWRQKFR